MAWNITSRSETPRRLRPFLKVARAASAGFIFDVSVPSRGKEGSQAIVFHEPFQIDKGKE